MPSLRRGDRNLKIFLAGGGYMPDNFYNFYRLESYLTAKQKRMPYNRYKDFILDSGIFSYLNGKDTKNVDWEKYVAEYADFVRENQIKNYVEVDVDRIVGYDIVKKLREMLEKKVGWKSMPVWHINRGYDDWEETIKEYNYVCFGAFLTDNLKKEKFPMIKKFLDDANKNNCKVHGLGFTSMEWLKKLKFYSVDSSSWSTGNRFGTVYKFEKDRLLTFPKKANTRITNQKLLGHHNFYEWVKFSQYADIKL